MEIFRPPLCIYKVMKDPKNLHIYDNLIEAEGAKSFLEAHGITTTLPDRHALYHQPHLIGVLGGVRLQVASENYIQAKELLEQIEKRSQLKVVDVDSIRERYSEDRKRTSVKWLARIFSAGVVIYWVWVLAQHLKDS